MKASDWRVVYNTMPKGLCGGDQFTLIADLESREAENAKLKAILDGDVNETETDETRRMWRLSAVRYADKLEAENSRLTSELASSQAQVEGITASLAQANARMEVMRDALKEVEWIRSSIAPQYCYCPICEHEQFTGHKDNCTMGKALSAQPKGDVREKVAKLIARKYHPLADWTDEQYESWWENTPVNPLRTKAFEDADRILSAIAGVEK